MLSAARCQSAIGFTATIIWSLTFASSCNKPNSTELKEIATEIAQPKTSRDGQTNYDLRRIRPGDNPLAETFERLRKRAIQDGKRVAILFSADWCQPCLDLDLELGNRHPTSSIGDVRIFQLKEEEWEDATRLNEVNQLRAQWYPTLWSYPVFILLDDQGNKIEEMKEAKKRLESIHIEPTLANWFLSTRPPAS